MSRLLLLFAVIFGEANKGNGFRFIPRLRGQADTLTIFLSRERSQRTQGKAESGK
jgi:hypothetical protein